MPTLTNILQQRTALAFDQREWLHMLTGDWQVLADILFADLLLVTATVDGPVIAAQARPATATTLFEVDSVGDVIERTYRPGIDAALASGEVITWGDDEVETTFIPVRYRGRNIAVVVAVSALFPDRVLSHAQQNHDAIAQALAEMITTGEFPYSEAPSGYRHGTPRVSDGVIHLNEEGVVIYASPNAISHFRRIGIDEPLHDRVLAELLTDKIDDYSSVDESLPVVLMGRAAWMAEVESHSVTVSMRALPLRNGGKRLGAMLLCRDVSELRRQEKELITKDATIREIHHRVKNNLQTVSALLRLQSRRASTEETRTALATAQRRVATIALVHEQLSQTINEVVDFDELFTPVLKMAVDIAVSDVAVKSSFTGSFGLIRAEEAAALSVVLNEIISNAVEHGLVNGGQVWVDALRDGNELTVTVSDDGVGLGDSVPGSGLGTQIVKTMVSSELNGRIAWEPGETGGTVVTIMMLLK
ncbi:sensor histidine kinase [Arcanobacterium pinnipediorum]|uniref:histidine kinase n=1 Tax=Arcanobacterium pinnipediorum TaxID=1503041 RepID=A0ABY5AI60_9ACTO|nr:PAS domain-containing sensor histidine kinase [Arcanobacterium pinnipediorum]USR79777.1 PAS domain-containing sensor histidine kinase [Arcanobacterium pinnipediorum]